MYNLEKKVPELQYHVNDLGSVQARNRMMEITMARTQRCIHGKSGLWTNLALHYEVLRLLSPDHQWLSNVYPLI